jgi:hypothetical protein
VQTSTNELKPFLSGLIGAAVAGMLMGAAFRPNIGDDDRPQGPQMASWTPGQSTGPFDDDGPVIADWKGAPPSYVVGTDALKAANWLGPVAGPLPNRDLEPLPNARDLQRIEAGESASAPDAATDAATLAAAPDADKAQPDDKAPPG